MASTDVRVITAALLTATVLGSQLAAAATSQYVERLPPVKPGKLLPSAGGLVLGGTTKPQLLSRWGPASICPDTRSCSWIVGIRRDGSRRPGVASDTITVVFYETTGWAIDLTLATSSSRTSRLHGWRLPGNVGIGTPFPAVRRAFPNVRWLRSTAANTSTWGVPSYEHAEGHYTLQLTFDRATREISKGRVVRLGITWQPPLLRCTLTSAAVAPPEGAAAGRRVTGSCTGAAIHAAFWGRAVILRVRFVVVNGGNVTSAWSPFDASCTRDTCHARPSDWSIDVTLGLSSPETRLEARVGPPATSSQVLRIPLG
jgi:hypothetical protein